MHDYNDLRSEKKHLTEKLIDAEEIISELKALVKKERIMEMQDELLEAKRMIHRYEIALDQANKNVYRINRALHAHLARHKPFESFYKDFLEKHVKSTII